MNKYAEAMYYDAESGQFYADMAKAEREYDAYIDRVYGEKPEEKQLELFNLPLVCKVEELF